MTRWADMTPEQLEHAKKMDIARKRSFKGVLRERWVCIQRRVRGQTAGDRKTQLWLGLPTCTREEFMAWASEDDTYSDIYDAWVASGYDRTLAPSIDRIDESQGYVLGNMRWLTVGEHNDISLHKGRRTAALNRQKKLAEVA